MHHETGFGPQGSPGESWDARSSAAKITSQENTSSDATTSPSHISPSQELFLPENRKKLLQHLLDKQFPAIRDLVGKLLESGFFLLDPAQVSFSVIKKIVVEADEYSTNNSYWEWVQSMAHLAIHEIISRTADELEEFEQGEVVDQNDGMRRVFNSLSLEQRRSLYLVGVMGHTVEEASQRCGDEPETIRNFVRLALRAVVQGMGSKGRSSEHGA